MGGRPRRARKCSECGEPLVAEGTYCSACGLDVAAVEEDAAAGGVGDVDLPSGYGGDEFDYDDFLASEGLASPLRSRVTRRRLFWVIVAIVALAAFVSAVVF